MDYHRIDKASHLRGGGFSPKKLRAMLLGVERRCKGDDEEGSAAAESSIDSVHCAGDGTGSGVQGCSTVIEEYKEVDIVGSVSESSSSVDAASGGHRSRDDSCDSESVASNFEFHKERAAPAGRVATAPPVAPLFSKPAPSKWDDAQKWIASPAAGPGRPGRVSGPQVKKAEFARQTSIKVSAEAETKRIDQTQDNREVKGPKDACLASEMDSKTGIHPESRISDSTVASTRNNSSTLLQSSETFLSQPPKVWCAPMRDMGTEMTPIASEEPSLTGTPVRATSPNSSRPSTPQRMGMRAGALADGHGANSELSEKELQMKTRREIMILGTQLGKTKIAAWASKQEAEKEASPSVKSVNADKPADNVTEIRAAVWEEAERTKYLARFKREEIKIQAWEDHQRAKIEAEMRKVEVEVEKLRAQAQDRLMSRLATVRHKAEEQRAAAEARRSQAAARTAEQAGYIRQTGHIPPLMSFWSCCS